MAVKILIKRKVSEDKSVRLSRLLKDLRVLTMAQPGYISGETLTRVDHPGESLVISTWVSAEAWHEWILSDERREIQNKIDLLLEKKTVYEVYANQ